MNYLEKINKVRENVQEWQKEHGKEFSYPLSGIATGEDPIDDWTYIVSPEEETEIIKYLERRGFLEILKEKDKSFQVKILPKKQPVIKLKTLELISRELKDHYTGYEITKLLEVCGADKRMIIYPNSKWHIFYGLFEELSIAQDKKAKELLFKIICESIHPLNLSGNKELSDKLIEKFNEYLKYDNLIILYSDKEQKHKISSIQNLVEIDEEEATQDFEPLIEEILPNINKCTFSEKVIELVAQVFEGNLSEFDIRKIITPLLNKNKPLSEEPFIKGYIDDWLEEKKWLYNFEKVLDFIKRKDENADKTIAGIIETLLHPLNYKADEEKTENIAQSVAKYLKYDNFYVQNIGKGYLVLSDQEMAEIHSSSPEFEEQERKDKAEDEEKIKQSKEILKIIRDTHQSYIDILELFCRDTKKPTKELNNAYIFLSNKIEKDIEKIGLKTFYNHIYFFRPFENDLYSAEAEYNKKSKSLSWDGIRPALYKAHSDIIKLLNTAEEDAIMTDEEKKLEDITKLISEKRIEKEVSKENEPKKTLKIEISKIPDLNIKSVEDNVLQKGKKRIHLPKFRPTDWAKITIRFINERDVLITADKKQVQSDYESLGFADDKKKKPNTAWAFLFGLSKSNGETVKLPKPIPETIRQHKTSLAQKLKAIFKNETDPFYDSTETQTYKIKIQLIPPQTDEISLDKYGTQEYLKETMIEKYD